MVHICIVYYLKWCPGWESSLYLWSKPMIQSTVQSQCTVDRCRVCNWVRMGLGMPGDLSFANSSQSPAVWAQYRYCRDIIPSEDACQQPAPTRLIILKACMCVMPDITGPSLKCDLLYTLNASGQFSKLFHVNNCHNVHAHLFSGNMQYCKWIRGWRPQLETTPQHKVKVSRSRVQHALALIAHSITCRPHSKLFDSQHFSKIQAILSARVWENWWTNTGCQATVSQNQRTEMKLKGGKKAEGKAGGRKGERSQMKPSNAFIIGCQMPAWDRDRPQDVGSGLQSPATAEREGLQRKNNSPLLTCRRWREPRQHWGL